MIEIIESMEELTHQQKSQNLGRITMNYHTI